MKNKEVIKSIQKKRLIFTVTTGRSGTAYMTAVFSYFRGVHACHEPQPEYAKVLRQVQVDPEVARRFLLEEKLPAITSVVEDIYVETSHLVCKGFLEPMIELGIIPDLIIHRRTMRDISLSLFKHGTIPGRTSKALMFYLGPDDRDVLFLRDFEKMHDYQLCYWYCLEIERRARKYKKIFQEYGGRVVETTLTGLKTVKGLDDLTTALDLKLKFPAWLYRMRFLRNSRFKVNQSIDTIKDVPIPENISELEMGVLENIERDGSDRWLEELGSN